jgi:hypothetical protein
MFNKLSLALLVSASLSCFGQVTTMGGTATTAGPGVAVVPVNAANAPLISTPDIALPGSGPAVGAPLSTASANDSRSSSGPSVYNPNSAGYVSAEATAAPATAAPAQPAVVPGSATAQPFENGIQHFQSGMPNAGNATMSLAQIARSYRAQHHQSARSFNNDSIAQMNAAGVRTGNLGPETSTVAAATPAPAPGATQNGQGTLMAENQPPALPQSDQTQPAPAAQPATSQASSTASQQRHANVEPAPAASSADNASQTPASPETGQSAGSAKLPQTASHLPLLLLLGGIGVAGGAVYWLRK